MTDTTLGVAGRFRVAVDDSALHQRGLADYDPDDHRRKTTLQTKRDGFVDGMEAANGYGGTFVKGGAAAVAQAVGAGFVLDYQALQAIQVNPFNVKSSTTPAQLVAEQLTSDFPTAAMMGHFGPGFEWLKDAPFTVETKEIYAARTSLARMQDFVDRKIDDSGAYRLDLGRFTDLAENDRVMASEYNRIQNDSPERQPNRAYSVVIKAQHPSGEMRTFEGIVHGIIGKNLDIGGEPTIYIWADAMRRGIRANQAPDVVQAPPTVHGISPGKERQLRASVADRFNVEMDYRFEGQTFVENAKPTSISSRMITKADSQAELDNELKFLAWNRANHAGFRFDENHTIEQNHVRIHPIDFETAAGKTHSVRFDVVSREDENKILTSGTLEIAVQKKADRPGLNLALQSVRLEPGELARVRSVGFPGASFAAQFVGGVIEKAETALINEEMASRGLLLPS